MKMMLMIAVLALLGTGCAAGIESIDCPGPNKTDITIRYGDSKIMVTNRVEVERDGRLVLKLQADRGYENAVVTLTGKDPQAAWIEAELKETEKNTPKAVICVDNQPVGTYYYEVNVDGVGTIDPRVDVGL